MRKNEIMTSTIKDFRIKWFLSLIMLALPAAIISQSLFTPDMDRLATQYTGRRQNAGLVIGIVQGGQTGIRGYGVLDRKNLVPPDGQTIFEIGSNTGLFTTTLMMYQSQAGLFSLYDPIQQYLPPGVEAPKYYPYVCEEKPVPLSDLPGQPERILECYPDPTLGYYCITFCDLASHTSGLPNAPKKLYDWNPFTLSKQMEDPYRDYSKTDLYAGLPKYDLLNVPGIQFTFSNLGMALLGNLVADISGAPYEELLAAFITRPLGMEDTRLHNDPAQEARLAPPHDRRGRITAHWNFDAMAPAGGLKSTADDLVRFLQANLRNGEDPLDLAFGQVHQGRVETPIRIRNQKTLAGYGWWVTNPGWESNQPVVWHHGGTGGFRVFLGMVRDTGTGVVVMSNSANNVDGIGFDLLQQLCGSATIPVIR